MTDPRNIFPLHQRGMEAVHAYVHEIRGGREIPESYFSPEIEEAFLTYAATKLEYVYVQNDKTVPAKKAAEQQLLQLLKKTPELFAPDPKATSAARIGTHNAEFAFMAYDIALNDLLANKPELDRLVKMGIPAIEAKPLPFVERARASQVEIKDLIRPVDLIQIYHDCAHDMSVAESVEALEPSARREIRGALFEVNKARIQHEIGNATSAFGITNRAYRHAQTIMEEHAAQLQISPEEASDFVRQYTGKIPDSPHFQAVCARNRGMGLDDGWGHIAG